MPLVIVTVKEHYVHWHKTEMIAARIWFVIEVEYFFNWLYSIIIFLQITYWVKLKPIRPKDTERNLWNAKNTIDHLKFLKLEAYYACYMLSFAICAVNIGFVTGDEGDTDSRSMFGRVEFYPCQFLFVLILVARVIDFGMNLTLTLRRLDEEK